jgi:signal transduction histidine kinase
MPLDALRPRLPRRTVRLRLTLVYGSLFVASGAALLVATDALWGGATNEKIQVPVGAWVSILGGLVPPPRSTPGRLRPVQVAVTAARSRTVHSSPVGSVADIKVVTGANAEQVRLVGAQLRTVATRQHTGDLHELLIFSGIAIAVAALVAIVVAWLAAGRVLRPLRTITSAARDISVSDLHQRLSLQGPNDELKELGNTFDDLLGRLEGSFQSQRQFVANASHELRTPLTTMRATLDVAVAKPGSIPEETVILANRLRDELDHVDRLLDSLLALARAQRGPSDDQMTLSFGDLAGAAIASRADVIAELNLDMDQEDRSDATVTGNETLLSRMVENIIDNAVKHNVRGGWVRVRTEARGTSSRLIVENGGPVLDQCNVEDLAQPFRRLGADRTGSDTGTGLGLSIIAAVAAAHDGHLELHARRGGGFEVVVELPRAAGALAGTVR